jgi:2,4-didehydro-3-deoxy-L-rhamnonate hydrolase
MLSTSERSMKLLSFTVGRGQRVGVCIEEGVIDLTRALAGVQPSTLDLTSMLAIIESGIDIDEIATSRISELKARGQLQTYLVPTPTFLPPILRPPKILAFALNFREHINEGSRKLDFYEEPIIFTKYSCNLIGHGGSIELPPFPQLVEEEHELALVVGRPCRRILPSEAASYIFGYTICNDVSARDRQRERMKMGQPYAYAKNFATFCPMGPWIVTAKELPDARNLRMEVRVNNQLRRSGSSSAMIFDPFEALAYCSDYTPMEPGDIISLGTFAGLKRLDAGDTVELEIERIGVLRNTVTRSSRPWRNFTSDAPTGPLIKERS